MPMPHPYTAEDKRIVKEAENRKRSRRRQEGRIRYLQRKTKPAPYCRNRTAPDIWDLDQE